MNDRSPDDGFEERLRAAFELSRQPQMPPAIRGTVDGFNAHVPLAARRPWRRRAGIAALLGAAALIVAIAALSLSSGTAPHPSPSDSAVSTVAPSGASNPTPVSTLGPVATPGPVSIEPWSGSFVPAALASADVSHLVLVGATGDGVGDGVVATSDDGGRGWRVQRLGVPPIDGVTAVGATIWATTACPAGASIDCQSGFIVSADRGASWRLTSVTGLWHPALMDGSRGWAVSPGGDLRLPSTVLATVDGGTTWTRSPAPCRTTAPAALAVTFVSTSTGWTACVGDSRPAHRRKSCSIQPTEAARGPWSRLSALTAACRVSARCR